MEDMTHLNARGEARMVDVSKKSDTTRHATATSGIRMKPTTLDKIKKQSLKKGDVLAAARVAGIMAAKKTPELIPLCHPILIDNVSVDFELIDPDFIRIMVSATSTGKTGVEMEALVAASASALTIYDMCKAIDRGMTIESTCLESKQGGKSGSYRRGEDE